MYSVGGGDIPGVVVVVPMPAAEVTTWRVKLTWDLETVDRRVQVTSRSKVGSTSNIEVFNCDTYVQCTISTLIHTILFGVAKILKTTV